MNPLTWAGARFRRWWQARLRPTDFHQLTQRNVYILPTAPGIMLAATLLVLLLASINFQLNLGYALTFLLAGCTVVGMHMGHATLRGLHLHLLPPQAQFLDVPTILTVQLQNPSVNPRYGVGLALQNAREWSWVEVPRQASCRVGLAWMAPHRGFVKLPTLRAETRFPMGAFQAWTVWQPASCAWVYPHPETPAPTLPKAQASANGSPTAVNPMLKDGDWEGVRGYQRGDTPKQIVWKKAAQVLAAGSGTLVSRDASPPRAAELWLDYATTGLADKEARLSRLCAWVLEAEKRGSAYGLRLPSKQLAPACGAAHQRQCLEALALC
jgi:uncharacterized protein (DUF58 family)